MILKSFAPKKTNRRCDIGFATNEIGGEGEDEGKENTHRYKNEVGDGCNGVPISLIVQHWGDDAR